MAAGKGSPRPSTLIAGAPMQSRAEGPGRWIAGDTLIGYEENTGYPLQKSEELFVMIT